MISTWPQQHPFNYQLKSEFDNYLINSSEISSLSFDNYQSNLLLGFKLTDQRNVEPILVNLPDLLAQNLAQLQSASMLVDIEAAKISNGQDLLLRQDEHQASSSEISVAQNSEQIFKEEEIRKEPSPVIEILKHFEHLDDPRADANQRHKLGDMISIAILAVICGADHWGQIEEFGKEKREWLSTFLELPFGIPSHDTAGSLFARLDPNQFRKGFVSWVNSIRKAIPGEVIAI